MATPTPRTGVGGATTPGVSTHADGVGNETIGLQPADKRNEAGPICIGDFVGLFIEELNGFMTADGFTDDGLYVQVLLVFWCDFTFRPCL